MSTPPIARVHEVVLADTSMLGMIAVRSIVSASVFAGVAVPARLLGGGDLLSHAYSPTTLPFCALAASAPAFVCRDAVSHAASVAPPLRARGVPHLAGIDGAR